MRVTAITNILPRKAKYIVNQHEPNNAFHVWSFCKPYYQAIKNVTYSNIMRIPLNISILYCPGACFHVFSYCKQHAVEFRNIC